MKKRTLISSVLLVAILACWGWFLRAHWHRFARLGDVDAGGLAALLALTVAGFVLRGVVLRWVSGHVGARLGLRESWHIAAATTFLNYLPVKAGIGAQTVYLKAVHKLPYARFAACFAATYLTQFLAISGVGLAICLGLHAAGAGQPVLTAGFAAFLAVCVVAALTPARWHYEGGSKLLSSLAHALASWHRLRRARGLLARIVFVQLVLILLRGCRLYVSFRLLGYEVSFPGAVMMTLAGFVIHLLGVVPGSLGTREAAMAGLGAVLGTPVEASLLAATLDRAAIMAVAFTWGPAASGLMLRGRRRADAAAGS